MQMLKAARERPLFNPSVEIFKLSNYVPCVKKEVLGKTTRLKKTVPKQPRDYVIDSDSENDLPIFHTPPDTPPAEKRLKRAKHPETPSSEDECAFSENPDMYRRFSARKRKQTSFLGVSFEQFEDNRGRRKRRQRSYTAINRRLFFNVEGEAGQQRSDPSREAIPSDPIVIAASEPIVHGIEKSANEDAAGVSKSLDEALVKEPKPITREMLESDFPIGTMVWGKLPGYCWWPGTIISYGASFSGVKDEQDDDIDSGVRAWVKWFGETQLSKISAERLAHYYEFKEYFQPLQFKGTYKKAVLASVKEAAKRCKFTFLSSSEDKKLRWQISEDSPLPRLISEDNKEPEDVEGAPTGEDRAPAEEDGSQGTPQESSASSTKRKSHGWNGKRGRGKDKAAIRLTSLEQEMLEWACGGFLPPGKDGILPAPEEQEMHVKVVPVGAENEERNQDDSVPKKKQKVMLLQVRSKAHFNSVFEGRAKLLDLCIGCGDFSVTAEHPLFHGGLCSDCKNDFMETAYLFDEDGSQMYCTICNAGDEVFMCDAENCSKVFCGPCVEKLCGMEELNRVRSSEKWLCYMCDPEHSRVGILEKREDWDKKLRDLFLNDREMEYEPPAIYRPISPEERRPIRVLGLFDGIATGLVVLKELGVEVAQYVASEIDTDAVYVSLVQHKEIIHVGDIQRITEKEIKAWGPFDLIMGGSPCNDLSVVNPARRGIYEGTGRLFFEFFRILSYARPSPDEDRPFFWLFENVVSMKPQDKQTISRFLQCNPVVVDAKDISAAHRARYFWGNLPGMNRPTTALPSDRLSLQSCLEPNCFRVAQFTKLRTITTKMNSIKQTKKAIFPVRIGGLSEEQQGDVLWCTEMERLFGFPEHYTDVANLGRAGRQRLLGKAWSVPVIRHLLSPLKDYFKSSTTKDGVAAGDKKCTSPVVSTAEAGFDEDN